MRSDENCLMELGGGLLITAQKYGNSLAYANKDWFEHP